MLSIDSQTIDNIGKLDKHIENLDKHFGNVANAAAQFTAALAPLSGLKLDSLDSITNVIDQLNKIGNAKFGDSLSKEMNTAKASADELNKSLAAAVENLQKLTNARQAVTGSLKPQNGITSDSIGDWKKEAANMKEDLWNKTKFDPAEGSDFSKKAAELNDMYKIIANMEQAAKSAGKAVAEIKPGSWDDLNQRKTAVQKELQSMSKEDDGYAAKKAEYQDLSRQIKELERDWKGVGDAASKVKAPTFEEGSLNDYLQKAAKLNNELDNMKHDNTEGSDYSKKLAELQEVNKKIKEIRDEKKATAKVELIDEGSLEDLRRKLNAAKKEFQRMTPDEANGSDYKKKIEEIQKLQQEYDKLAQEQKTKVETPKFTGEADITNAINAANDAKSIEQMAAAYKKLKEARGRMNLGDESSAGRLDTINRKMAELHERMKNMKVAVEEMRNSFNSVTSTVGNVAQQIAAAFSINAIGNFIKSMATVRGNFELQQTAMESILSDKGKADEIFQKTVDLAVKSPFTVQQLVTYTKQLAAYRIESDELYDTTKRLADVSAGLGVDMNRLILAYGQVKAAAYLKGPEVRQFTEAGVNMYGELQRYFKEVKGEAYTTGQIFKMISDKKVLFEDVEQVFKRLTDEGGLFYNMQEIQADTLRGKISNLKDSYDIMMNTLGQQNEGMLKGAVDASKYLLDNFESIIPVLKTLIALIVTLKLHSVQTGTAISKMASVVASPSIANASGLIKKLSMGLRVMRTVTIAAGRGFVTLGKNMLGALAANWPVLALMAATDLLMKYIEKKRQDAETTAKIADENIKLTTSIEEAGTHFAEAAGNVSKQRDALQELIDVANKEKVTVDFDINSVSDEDLQKNFDELQAKLNAHKNIKIGVSVSFEMTGTGGDFTDTGKDFAAEANVAQVQLNKMVEAIKYAKLHMDDFDESVQRYIQTADTEMKQGEGQVAYLTRIADLYNKISNGQLRAIQEQYPFEDLDFSSSFETAAKRMDKYANGLFALENTNFSGIQKNFEEQIDGMADNIESAIPGFQNIAEKYPLLLKAEIDSHLAQLQLGELATEMAKERLYARFGLQPDDKQIEKMLNNVDSEIRKFINDNTYVIDLKVDSNASTWAQTWANSVKSLGDNAKKTIAALEGLEKARGKGYIKETIDIPREEAVSLGLINEGDQKGKQQVAVNTDKYYQKAKKKAEQDLKNAIELNYDDNDKDKNKNKNKNKNKDKRDIPQERFSLLKTMQSEYQSLLEYFDSADADNIVLDTFGDEMKALGLKLTDGLLPDKTAITAKLKELATAIKDATKRNKALQEVAKIEVGFEKEKLKKDLEEAGKEAESVIDSLDLFNKFKDMGLSTSQIKHFFPDIVTNYKDAAAAIDKAYAGIEKGENAVKALRDNHKKLLDKQIEETRKNMESMVKDYGQKLSEQLQLDMWYYQELAKIRNAYILDSEGNKVEVPDEMKNQWEENLTKTYKEKTHNNLFEEFKGSETYITILQNLDNLSLRTITRLEERLKGLKESLSSLDPSQMKELAEVLDKLKEKKMEQTPFSSFIKALKEVKELRESGRTEDFLNGDIISKEQQNTSLTLADNELAMEITELQTVLELRQQESDFTGLSAEQQQLLSQYVGLTNEQLAIQIAMKKSLQRNNEQQIRQNKADINADETDLSKYSDARESTEKLKEAWETLKDIISETWSKMEGLLESMGVDMDGDLGMVLEIGGAFLEAAEQAFELYVQQQLQTVQKQQQLALQNALIVALGETEVAELACGVAANAAMGVVGWILLAIQAIATILTSIFKQHDKRLENQIQDLKDDVDELSDAFDKLEEAMENALSFNDIQLNYKLSAVNLKKQISDYKRMMQLEGAKKNSDEDKIEEYRDAIEDCEEQLEELREQYIQDLGGFGSDESYKDAAQEFIDAWIDAFNEGEDGLEALEDKFNDYFNNLLKKQVALKAAETYIKPILEAFDAAVSEDSEEGVTATENELSAIKKLKEEKLSGLSNYLTELMDILGITPSDSASTNLSELQQGIEGITETTAEALEAYLNSMRFFLATQQGDVAAIRLLLENNYGSTQAQTTENPTLSELRGQTELLRALNNSFSSVMKAGHTQGGYGLKVFI